MIGGEYAGGAASLRSLGRRVGVVVGKELIVLPSVAGPVEVFLDERCLPHEDIDGLESFLEPSLLKPKGMLSLEDVLVCEQNVGACESAIL